MRTSPPEGAPKPGLARQHRERGQALVEFALLLPVMLVVLFVIVDFGVGISRWVVVTNAAREGARLGAAGEDDLATIKLKAMETSGALLEEDDISVLYRDKNGNDEADRGDSVKVTTSYEYRLITPLKAFLGLAFDRITLKGCADMRLEVPLSGVGTVPADSTNQC